MIQVLTRPWYEVKILGLAKLAVTALEQLTKSQYEGMTVERIMSCICGSVQRKVPNQ